MNVDLLRKKAERARAKLGLDEAQLRLIQQAAHGCYEEVAYDLEPDIKRHGTRRRSTIMEVALDAGRLEHVVRRLAGLPSPPFLKNGDSGSDHPLVKACRAYDLVKDLVGPAFPYAEYEVGRN